VFLLLIGLLSFSHVSDTRLIKNSLRPELLSAVSVIHQQKVEIRANSSGNPTINRIVKGLLFQILKEKGISVAETSPVVVSYSVDGYSLDYRKIYRGIFKKPDFERSLRLRLFLEVKQNKTLELAKLIEVTKIDTIAMKDVRTVHNLDTGTVSESSGVPVGVSMLIGVLFYFIYFIIK